jgi:AbrB family looped-hinge helix DNA binding protein
MSESVITRKGQVTIPKAIRDHFDAREGERVRFAVRGDEVILKIDRGTVLDLRGSVKPRRPLLGTDTVRRQVKRAVAARTARRG